LVKVRRREILHGEEGEIILRRFTKKTASHTEGEDTLVSRRKLIDMKIGKGKGGNTSQRGERVLPSGDR